MTGNRRSSPLPTAMPGENLIPFRADPDWYERHWYGAVPGPGVFARLGAAAAGVANRVARRSISASRPVAAIQTREPA